MDNERNKNISQITAKNGTKVLTTTKYIKLGQMNCIVKISVPEKYRDYSFTINIESTKGYYQPWVHENGKAILNFREGLEKNLVKKNKTTSGIGALTTSLVMEYGLMKSLVSIAIPELLQDMILSININSPKQWWEAEGKDKYPYRNNLKTARC
ncbi:hypothetical protein MSHOH_1126 [Methanosarcina horonobensis HB-1 = JCM 15518]|uniref:Uncharacterized protein n=1 Tax=Methanosarcina horonobensis HB-1 = JCM 15518 TaxID=1434110 RepID=A0A0E3S835_9EURY|nr:hypothetical protein [Methanosarcina horonobensis]AKB77609.1 hypothetical protein MSHOH_1126 [Methanosarcina horonobensis HB-1 = JCM 15518]